MEEIDIKIRQNKDKERLKEYQKNYRKEKKISIKKFLSVFLYIL